MTFYFGHPVLDGVSHLTLKSVVKLLLMKLDQKWLTDKKLDILQCVGATQAI